MKLVAIFGPRKAGLVDRPDPKAKDNIVVVKVHSAPLCTEYHMFEEGKPAENIGHEAAGEVVAVDKTCRLKVGDRVLVQPQNACGRCELCVSGAHIHCQHQQDVLKITASAAGTGTYAQMLLKPDWLLTPIPDGLSYDHAAMGCCGLGPTFGSMELMNVQAFDTVLITGLGPVGLGGVINAHFRGARVIGVDSNPYRAALAKTLGADAVVDPRDERAVQKVMDLTAGLGADKSIETSGTEGAKGFLLQAAARTGQVSLVGWSGQLDASTIIGKGLRIHGAWHYRMQETPRLMKVIQRSRVALEKFITHTFPMSQIQQAWELQVSGNCGKVILHPQEA
jgi:threonine dehydrogenase-like Zn-dependent dehydrogenase